VKVSGTWLDQAQPVFELLSQAGFQAWIVGGCVRDALLDRPVGDVDFATQALPEQVLSLAKDAKIRAIPTGIDHGTVTLIVGETPYEVTTFRRDVATDGRRATVAFAKDIKTDAQRRDFTLNALYADAAGQISDPLGGLVDLPARRIRFIGDAEMRIREDALRILRFFRFHAWIGQEGDIDAGGLAACAELSELTDVLSRERITTEMSKLLLAPNPAPAAASMAASGNLGRILPGADAALLAPLIAAEAGLAPSWLRRLAALGGARERLRLSRAEQSHLDAISACLSDPAPRAVRAYLHGQSAATDAAMIASGGAPLEESALAEFERGAAAQWTRLFGKKLKMAQLS